MSVIKFLGLVQLLTGCSNGASGVEDYCSPNDSLSTEDTVLSDAVIIDNTGMVDVPDKMLRSAFRAAKFGLVRSENQEITESQMPRVDWHLVFIQILWHTR